MAEELHASLPRLYQQSILIEFWKGSTVVEALVLPVPPESISISQAQRKTITQTFGGAIIDHFGLALGMLTITGHTGTQNEKRETISGPEKTVQGPWNSAKSAEQILQRIAKYPVANNTRQGFASLECRIYDLTNSISESFNFDKSENAPLGYIVSIDDYTVSKNANKYGFYQYTLKATILDYLGQYRPIQREQPAFLQLKTDTSKLAETKETFEYPKSNLPSNPKPNFFVSTVRDIQAAARTLNTVRNRIQSSIHEVTKNASSLFTALEDIETNILAYEQIVNQITNALDSYIERTTDLVRFPAKLANSLYRTTKNIYDYLASIPMRIEQSAEFVIADYTELKAQIDYDIANSVSFWKPLNDLAAALSVAGKNSTGAEAIAPVTLEPSNSKRGIDNEGTTKIETIAYGYRTIIKTPDQKLDKLAQEYLGDFLLGSLILNFNNIPEWDKVPVGTPIRIPILTEIDRDLNNAVYSVNPLSILGTDILRDNNSFLVPTENGDIALVSQQDNLIQAVLTRLSTKIGADVRKTAYGVTIEVGGSFGTKAAQDYVSASILDTLMQEPRIKEIERIEFSIEANTTIIKVTITPIVGERITVDAAA